MLTETRKHVTFVDCPARGRRRAPHLRGDLRRPRPLPRAPAHLDRGDRRVAAPGRRRRPRHPHRPGQARRAHRGLLDDHRRSHIAGHAGRDRHPGPRRVPRHRHGPAGRGSGRPSHLLLRLRRTRHAAHDLRARLARERADGRHGLGGRPLPRRADAQPRALDRRQGRGRAGGLREGDEGGHRLRRRPRHGLRLGAHRLAQHDVTAAVGHRQRDGGDAAPPPPAGRGLGRDARRRLHRRGRPRRQLPRPEGHRAAHPRRRALHAHALQPPLLREVGGGGHAPRTTWPASRSRRSSPRTRARPRTSTARSWTSSRPSAASDDEAMRRARRE